MTATTGEFYSAMELAHSRSQTSALVGNRTFPADTLADWQIQAVQKLATLRGLGSNWNSYGSAPVSDEVLDVAMDLVAHPGIPSTVVPRVVPISGGGVQLGWANFPRELDIALLGDLTVNVVVSVGDEEPVEYPFSRLTPRNLSILLEWLSQTR